MKTLFLLASYPKSGNTWVRAFLNNYRDVGNTPVDINALKRTPVLSARTLIDEMLNLDSGDLTSVEIDRLRPAIYRRFAQTGEYFCKIHDALRYLPNGDPIFPADAIQGVIYIIRSPLDVAVSYAYHNNSTFDESIEFMSDDNHGLFMTTKELSQIQQLMFSWSNHVRSWVDQSVCAVHLVRYEDLIFGPTETFANIVRFIDQEYDPVQLEKAIQFSSFDKLKKQEAEQGFREKNPHAGKFFRKGKVGDWRSELTPKQVERIVDAHGDVMRRYGYLTSNGKIVY